jgi:pimeloyl-ACP methyl ester carboxylesterase
MQLHLREWGDRDAQKLVCLHGVQAYGGRFRRLAEERLASGFHVLAPDLRGHARSGRGQPWTLDAHLEDVLETVGPASYWIGHSFGGRLVAELIAREPGLVERAVLLDPALVVPLDYAQFLADQELAQDLSFATEEEAVAAGVAGRPSPVSDDVLRQVREQVELTGDGHYRFAYSREAVATGFLECAKPPTGWHEAGLPTLIVAGSMSKFVSVGEVEIYRGALGGALEVVVVPGGHSVLWDAFDETADAIDRFLAA